MIHKNCLVILALAVITFSPNITAKPLNNTNSEITINNDSSSNKNELLIEEKENHLLEGSRYYYGQDQYDSDNDDNELMGRDDEPEYHESMAREDVVYYDDYGVAIPRYHYANNYEDTEENEYDELKEKNPNNKNGDQITTLKFNGRTNYGRRSNRNNEEVKTLNFNYNVKCRAKPLYQSNQPSNQPPYQPPYQPSNQPSYQSPYQSSNQPSNQSPYQSPIQSPITSPYQSPYQPTMSYAGASSVNYKPSEKYEDPFSLDNYDYSHYSVGANLDTHEKENAPDSPDFDSLPNSNNS